jgi:hypothetical protein
MPKPFFERGMVGYGSHAQISHSILILIKHVHNAGDLLCIVPFCPGRVNML